MNKIIMVIVGFIIALDISAQEYNFNDNNIVAEINIQEETLKKIEKNSVLNLKMVSDLNESQISKWLENGRSHHNVQSIKVKEGKKEGEYNLVITFKNGLDYATGKELFSSTLFIDFFILNGEKIATNRFVSQNLSHQ